MFGLKELKKRVSGLEEDLKVTKRRVSSLAEKSGPLLDNIKECDICGRCDFIQNLESVNLLGRFYSVLSDKYLSFRIKNAHADCLRKAGVKKGKREAWIAEQVITIKNVGE